MAVADVSTVVADARFDRNGPIEPVLSVSDLHVSFHTLRAVVRAVNGISFTVGSGETVGILGESGSGKSVSAGAVMGLLESPPARVSGGIRFRDIDLLNAPEREMRRIRGDRISMVYQDAATALNPGLTVGYQIGEMFRVHRAGTSRADALRHAIELMDRVKIPSARQRVHSYPYEFSGGMSQRVMIAIAIALGPDILIADEPTTALDVTVQAQIMLLLAELRRETDMSLVLITHDIGLIAENADRVLVMYAGRIVESGPTAAVAARPAHPYTAGLLSAVPHADAKGRKLTTIEGMPPVLTAVPSGCAFHPRCARRQPICKSTSPSSNVVSLDRSSACHFAAEVLRG